jgi:lipoprotein NlpI
VLSATAWRRRSPPCGPISPRADAENAYLQAVRIRPSYYPAYFNLGIFYLNRGEYGKAMEPLSLVVKLAPENAEGHTNPGTLFYYTERLDEALEEYASGSLKGQDGSGLLPN